MSYYFSNSMNKHELFEQQRVRSSHFHGIINSSWWMSPTANLKWLQMLFNEFDFSGHTRTAEEVELLYDELLHIKALSHLSTMVKRELAAVITFEAHPKAACLR